MGRKRLSELEIGSYAIVRRYGLEGSLFRKGAPARGVSARTGAMVQNSLGNGVRGLQRQMPLWREKNAIATCPIVNGA